jgi:Mn2+/Fe2+ NRAMP family transporter
VGLVFAAIGASTGALSQSLNAAIIVMVILTTFLAPPLLRWAFSLSGDANNLATDAIAAESE